MHLDLHFERFLTRRQQLLLLRQHFVTTPTSMLRRLTGEEAFTDGILLGDGSTRGSTGNVVVVPAATTTLTLTAALHGDRTLNVASTGGLALTPPAATGTGLRYRLVCSAAITGGSLTFDAKAGNASDKIYGAIQTYKATTYTPYAAAPTVANANLFTYNGTTSGGAAVGDWVEFLDVATNIWLVTGGFAIQSGTIISPFTNH